MNKLLKLEQTLRENKKLTLQDLTVMAKGKTFNFKSRWGAKAKVTVKSDLSVTAKYPDGKVKKFRSLYNFMKFQNADKADLMKALGVKNG